MAAPAPGRCRRRGRRSGCRAAAAIRDRAATLIDLSRRIHAAPELGYQEHQASRWVGDVLADGGFDVRRAVCDLPTALTATHGSGALCVGICAEYDALPDIGHACGHNLIAASAVGAAFGLAAVADDLDVTCACSARRRRKSATPAARTC